VVDKPADEQDRMQRMTEPGAMQRVADTLSIAAYGREQERQSVLEPVARPIQPLLLPNGSVYRKSGIADPIFRMVRPLGHGTPPVRESESTRAPHSATNARS
jgi:hypothetical protein